MTVKIGLRKKNEGWSWGNSVCFPNQYDAIKYAKTPYNEREKVYGIDSLTLRMKISIISSSLNSIGIIKFSLFTNNIIYSKRKSILSKVTELIDLVNKLEEFLSKEEKECFNKISIDTSTLYTEEYVLFDVLNRTIQDITDYICFNDLNKLDEDYFIDIIKEIKSVIKKILHELPKSFTTTK